MLLVGCGSSGPEEARTILVTGIVHPDFTPPARMVSSRDAGPAEPHRASHHAPPPVDEAACAKEREAIAEYEATAAKNAAEGAERRRLDAEAASWVKAHCEIVPEPAYGTKPYVDAQGFVRMGQAVVGWSDKLVCPANTPEDVIRSRRLTRSGQTWVRVASLSRNQSPDQVVTKASDAIARVKPRLSERCGGAPPPVPDYQSPSRR